MMIHNELNVIEEFYHLLENETGLMGHDFNAFFNDTLPHYAFIINQRESTVNMIEFVIN